MTDPLQPGEPTLLGNGIVGKPTGVVEALNDNGFPDTLYSMEDTGRLIKTSLTPGSHFTTVGFLGSSEFADDFNPGAPQGSLLTEGSVIYGTTPNGGASGDGIVYSINEDGSGSTLLHDFAIGGGSAPMGGLTAVGTTLYGTTSTGEPSRRHDLQSQYRRDRLPGPTRLQRP